MKITDVTVTMFEWPDPPKVSYYFLKRDPSVVHDMGLVTIHTDEGVEGHALLGHVMSPSGGEAKELIRLLKPVLMGQDPLQRERLYKELNRRGRLGPTKSLCALDLALWDLMGKVAGLPLYRILGAYRDKMPVYCSSDHLPTPQDYADEAIRYKEMNWQAYKIHPAGEWRADIEICQAVRDAVGPDYRIMLDSTFLYDYPQALRVGRAIEEMDYYWYEDPLGDQDIYNYVKLKQKLDIPIIATERPVAGLDSYASWVTAQATDFLRGDVALKGGITPVLKTAHLAEAFGMNYEVHVAGNATNNIANLHVELSIPNTEYHEVIMPVEAATYGALNPLRVDPDGYVRPPEGPGLGVEYDFDLIKKHQLTVLR